MVDYHNSLRDLVELHTRQISDRVLEPGMKDLICKISDTFPQDLARDFIFESKLYSSEKTADFCLKIKKENIASLKNSVLTKLNTKNSQLWENLLQFCDMWQKDPEFNQMIELLWFEYDISKETDIDDFPVLFFQISPVFNSNVHSKLSIIHSAIKLLNPEVSSRSLTNLDKCFEILPGNSEIKHIGVTPSRNNNDIRMCISSLQGSGVMDILNYIPAKDLVSTIQLHVDSFENLVDSFSLHIDIGDEIRKKVGIELRKNSYLVDPECYKSIIEKLKECQIKLDDKINAIYNLYHISDWHTEYFLEGLQSYYCLHYIKLLFLESESVQGKAYMVATSQPPKKDDMILAEVDGEAMMIDVEGGTSYFLNETALIIYKMLNQGKSEEEITTALMEEYEAEPKTVQEDIRAFRTKLEQQEVTWGKNHISNQK